LGLCLSLPSTFSSVVSASFRINRKVKIIATSSLLNVASSIIMTLLLVIKFKMGMLGSLLGNLTGNLLASLFIVIRAPRFTFPDINFEKVKDLLRYSTPTLLAQLFGLTIPLYSQWSIKDLLSLQQLGLYAIALKFTIPLTVVLTMFQQAYAPYKFQILKTDKDPKKVFIQIMNLFVFCFGTGIIIVTLFAGDVLKFMTAPSYHESAIFVFYLALIPFAQGLYFMFSTGMEFAKSPVYRPLISGLGLLTVLILNKYLIEKFGIPGAAISIVCSWLSMALGNLIYSQFLYRIKYNWFLIFGVVAGTITIGFMINKYLQEMFLMKMGIMIAIAGGAFLLAKKMTNGKLSLGFIKAFSTKKLNE
ncbi:MAG TPA: oligosaccharide flippase family protein, partial [Chitinophagaceae bacterium]|nr:oligosaccharide flippase family protein [Chitinophagaceae bacterium]